MTMRILAAIGFGTVSLLYAADEPKQAEPKQDELKQIVEVSNTQHLDFPAGGTLRLKNSIGVLTVEAWDQPGMEITTVKSTKHEYAAAERAKKLQMLDKVHVAAERRGDEVVVTTDFPRFRAFPPPYPLESEVGFRLEYHIKAPANTRIIDERHDVGEVNIDGLAGDIDVNLLQGEIMLHLPQEGQYDITAKSDFGSVNSDFPGVEKRRRWLVGHRVVNGNSQAMHKLSLKVGWGDVVILKTRIPKEPASLLPAPKPEGL